MQDFFVSLAVGFLIFAAGPLMELLYIKLIRKKPNHEEDIKRGIIK